MLKSLAGAVVMLGLFSGSALASHVSVLGSIDEIDHVFGAGGGTVSGSLGSGTDDDWLVFGANAGDSINITVNEVGDWFLNAVLLQDTGNGVFEVGDEAGITDFNSSNVGEGSPLEVLAHIGALEFSDSGSLLGFIAPFTGQFAIGLTSANDNLATGWQVTLSGNTGTVGSTVVPLPAAFPLLVSAMAGFGLIGWRKRRRSA